MVIGNITWYLRAANALFCIELFFKIFLGLFYSSVLHALKPPACM